MFEKAKWLGKDFTRLSLALAKKVTVVLPNNVVKFGM